MKKIKNIFRNILAGSILALSGCNIIDIVPENALTYENAFDTPEEMEAAVSTLEGYINVVVGSTAPLEEIGMLYNGANKKEGGGQKGVAELVNHDWLPSMGMGLHNWEGHYQMIGYANLIESNMKDSYPQDKYNFLIGQAEFAKAYAYFDLGRSYGWAPIVPDNDFEAPAIPTSSPDDVLKKAEEYGEKAFAHCPKFADLYHTDGTKITDKQYASKEICAALLAYTYAWHASITEVNISESDRRSYLEKSEKYASMLIDGELKGYARLEPSIEALMSNTLNGRHGQESIFEIELDPKFIISMPRNALYTANYTFGYPYHHDILDESRAPRYTISCKRVIDLYGGLGTTDDRMKFFFPKTETRYDASKDEEATALDKKMVTKRVPWGPPAFGLYMTIYEGGFPDVAPNRAYVRKFNKQFIYSDSPDRPKSFVNFDTNKIVWRLADLILLRAETRNFLGKVDGAIQDLNTIRRRAQAVAYPAPADSGKDLQLVIFQERERELIYENHRFWDIRRNKDYYKKFLPAAYRMLTQQDLNNGALYYPTPELASQYNVYLTPNKYWFSRQN